MENTPSFAEQDIVNEVATIRRLWGNIDASQAGKLLVDLAKKLEEDAVKKKYWCICLPQSHPYCSSQRSNPREGRVI